MKKTFKLETSGSGFTTVCNGSVQIAEFIRSVYQEEKFLVFSEVKADYPKFPVRPDK